LEAIEMRDLRENGPGRRLADSGDRRQQIAPSFEIGMIVEVLANLALDLRDMFVECGNDLPNGGSENGCLRGLRVHRLSRGDEVFPLLSLGPEPESDPTEAKRRRL
jgi:hypothetical protein